MGDVKTNGARPDPVGRALVLASTVTALFGGFILFGLTIMTVASIVGRVVFSRPIPGDFELVEIGMAVAIFSFLPYCQISRGNVIVDLFTQSARPSVRALLDTLGNLIFTVIAAILTWRVAEGLAEVSQYGESSMILRIPVWWGYVPSVLFLGFLTLVCAYTTWRSAVECLGAAPEETR